jgi:hypothetical protein
VLFHPVSDEATNSNVSGTETSQNREHGQDHPDDWGGLSTITPDNAIIFYLSPDW